MNIGKAFIPVIVSWQRLERHEIKMTGEVKITVRGVQTDADGEKTVTETVHTGECIEKGNSLYLLYEESFEGETATTKNTLKWKKGVLELTRKGLINTRMVFEPGKTHMTDYASPYGLFQLGIQTERLFRVERQDGFELHAEYVLTAQEEPVSRCKLAVKACWKLV